MLEKILLIVDVDSAFIPLTYYNLYLNYQKLSLKEKSESIKNKLLLEYPKSVYSNLINNPNYLSAQDDSSSSDLQLYENIYNIYLDKSYTKTLESIENKNALGLKDKYTFLSAISKLNLGDTIASIELLNEVKRGKEKELSNFANNILNTLKDPSKLIEANRVAIEKTPYKYVEEIQHFVMFVLPRKDVDISFLKTLISDYNTSSYSTEIFEINAMLMGIDFHVITVKFFENANRAFSYCMDVPYSAKIIKELKKSEHYIFPISVENFQEFYRNKDISGYSSFYKDKYLAEK